MSDMSKKAQPKTLQSTPKMAHRWTVEFEDELNLDVFAVQSVSPIRYDPSNGGWQPISIDFIEIMERSAFASMVTGLKNGNLQKPIIIHSMDGPGNKMCRIMIASYKVLGIVHDGLNYGNDELVMSHLLIQPMDIQF